MITNVIILQFFRNNNVPHGVYTATIGGNLKVFVQNGDSVGVVAYYQDEPADKCISIVTDAIKAELLEKVNKLV